MSLALLSRFAPALTKVLSLSEKAVKGELMSFINFVTNAATTVAIGTSIFKGQEVGGVLNFVDGFVDVSEEKYYANGRAQSGTFTGACGNVANSLAVAAYATLRKTGKIFNLIPGFKNYSGIVDGALLLWQGTSLADEAFRGDGDVVKDKFDILGNVISIIKLLALLKGIKIPGLFGKARKIPIRPDPSPTRVTRSRLPQRSRGTTKVHNESKARRRQIRKRPSSSPRAENRNKTNIELVKAG